MRRRLRTLLIVLALIAVDEWLLEQLPLASRVTLRYLEDRP